MSKRQLPLDIPKEDRMSHQILYSTSSNSMGAMQSRMEIAGCETWEEYSFFLLSREWRQGMAYCVASMFLASMFFVIRLSSWLCCEAFVDADLIKERSVYLSKLTRTRYVGFNESYIEFAKLLVC